PRFDAQSEQRIDGIAGSRLLQIDAFARRARVFVSAPALAGAYAVYVWLHGGGCRGRRRLVFCALVDVAGRRESLGARRFGRQRRDAGGRFGSRGGDEARLDAIHSGRGETRAARTRSKRTILAVEEYAVWEFAKRRLAG